MMRTLLFTAAALLLATMPGVVDAQDDPYPFVVTMSGPTTVSSGESVTYAVHYQFTDPATVSADDIVIGIPRNTSYISSEVTAGPPGTLANLVDGDSVRWSVMGNADETEGTVELTVRVDEGFVGVIRSGCYVPGTETFNPESDCSFETQVVATTMLPETGRGAGVQVWERSEISWLLWGGAALLAAGLAVGGVGVVVRRRG